MDLAAAVAELKRSTDTFGPFIRTQAEGWRDGPQAPEPDIPDARGGDVFLYIYTSGTTGYPKPAIVRHLRFTLGGITLAGLLGVEAGETIYAPLPLYHGESLFVGFAPAFRAGGAFAPRRC